MPDTEAILPYARGLRVLPMLTDGAIDFLDGLIFEIKAKHQRNPHVVEFGGGNSTLYFLQRGCTVRVIEHEQEWARRVQAAASAFGLATELTLDVSERPYADQFSVDDAAADVVLIDGRDRMLCLQRVTEELFPGVIVLDNTERVIDRYAPMHGLLRAYALYHFEQRSQLGALMTPPGTRQLLDIPDQMPADGLAAGNDRDRAGNVSKGRHITTVAVHRSRGEYTSMGRPLEGQL